MGFLDAGQRILVLRNPSDREQTIRIRLQDAFELPSGAAQDYVARSPWQCDAGGLPFRCARSSRTHFISLRLKC